MKILNIDDMLEAGNETDLPNISTHIQAIERAATALQKDLAAHLNIGAHQDGATWEGKAYAGTCAAFYPLNPGDPCPEVIDQADEGGDWDLQPYETTDDGQGPL